MVKKTIEGYCFCDMSSETSGILLGTAAMYILQLENPVSRPMACWLYSDVLRGTLTIRSLIKTWALDLQDTATRNWSAVELSETMKMLRATGCMNSARTALAHTSMSKRNSKQAFLNECNQEHERNHIPNLRPPRKNLDQP
jgi:hypothetical protein